MTIENKLTKILYVEDEEDIVAIAQVALEDIGGFTVKYCASWKDVLNAVSEKFQPDMILLDVMVPGMDGPTILAELRKRPGFEKIPAIFMTAKVQSDEIEKYKQMGVVDIITKPFDPMKLSDKLNQIWMKSHGQ